MSIRQPSKLQRVYLFHRMNDNLTKQDSARLAGYTESSARTPQKIEQSRGFNIAVANLASETGNTIMKVYSELKARDLSKEDTRTILNAIDVLSKAWERFTPQSKQGDSDLSDLFSKAISIEVTPSDVPSSTDSVAQHKDTELDS